MDWLPSNEMMIIQDQNTNRQTCYSTVAVLSALVAFYRLNKAMNTQENQSIENMLSEDAYLFLDHNALSGFLGLIGKNDKILEVILGLSSGIEHWKAPLKNLFLLLNWWLRGKNPPPRCKAFFEGSLCLEEADTKSNSPFCIALHKCTTISCKNERPHVTVPFCNLHNCLYQEKDKNMCKNEGFKTSNFCPNHVCMGCLINSSPKVKCRDPIACEDHKCAKNGCLELQIYPHRFCQRHICEECASTGDFQKRASKNPKSTFCEVHACLVPSCTNKRVNETTQFCTLHVCRMCTVLKILKGVDQVCPASQLCKEHRCFHSLCRKEKIAYSQNCNDHSCKECRGNRINAAIDKPPRNHCVDHMLCEYTSPKGKSCNALSKMGSFYCAEHEKAQMAPKIFDKANSFCSGYNKQGKSCRSKQLCFEIKGKQYCQAHVFQAPEESSSSGEENDYDEEENEEAIIKALAEAVLVPVIKVKAVEPKFKRVQCTARAEVKTRFHSNVVRCDVSIFSDNMALSETWLCPLHRMPTENAVNKSSIKEIEVEDQIKVEAEAKKEVESATVTEVKALDNVKTSTNVKEKSSSKATQSSNVDSKKIDSIRDEKVVEKDVKCE